MKLLYIRSSDEGIKSFVGLIALNPTKDHIYSV